MRYVLDAGALIAVDGDDRAVMTALKIASRDRIGVMTVAPVVGEVWRHGARQARLARTLAVIRVDPVDLDAAQDAGELLARSGTSDIVDALLALQVADGDRVFTSDPRDIAALLDARTVSATMVVC